MNSAGDLLDFSDILDDLISSTVRLLFKMSNSTGLISDAMVNLLLLINLIACSSYL